MARVFLAGATGVLGRRLVPLLLADGHHVTGLARSTASADRIRQLGAEPAAGDALDADSVRAAVLVARPDVVMHQLTDLASRDFAANSAIRVVGTRNLVDAALAADVRRFVVQSIAFAYEPGDTPAREDTPLDVEADEPRRTTVRGVAELEAQAARVPSHVVLRYGTFYGPGTWYAPDGLMATGPLAANRDVTSFVHIDDAATAALRSLDWGNGPVNVCDDEPAPGFEWVPEFCAAVGAEPPARSDQRTGFARGADNGYARHSLGWQPVWPSWRDGFKAMTA
ncbi:NAD-dependent epimerase/dehydratase family protein [Kutzneria kofuensis]|uniref:Nucleoside-diphosphate-sugar epimerase n=1 Tax=Kutzneria kofuensis TaxID=103725 RepID=A0A7W9KRK6_9PSEU|nr:NAD(P)-dependent oxidoreductase [Kutzneria kofuensis]MBB5897419.1 nucleoside-diphosphate-sugar epimerase [Kutzneria kofuensis]